ncbi:MAG: DUF4956 domain-containing protein [bacterium]|nr:DUF4956 domain-containing protein [Myxococcales bacterium]MCB9552765.1 DUF4956 domain-containing protein [Myxococcales bacterium]
MDPLALFDTGLGAVTPAQAGLSLLMAFVLAKGIAFAYEMTYEGLSYNRSYVQSLVLGGVVACVLMMAIGDNLARGLGILGTMALVRFRTNVRESRDLIFMFAALAVGVAAGVRAYAVGVTGAAAFGLVAAWVHWSPFARRVQFDGLLRFWLARDPDGQTTGADRVRVLLGAHCRRYTLVALRDVAQGETLEYAYQVQLRDTGRGDRLVEALGAVDGLTGLSLLLQDAHTEL